MSTSELREARRPQPRLLVWPDDSYIEAGPDVVSMAITMEPGQGGVVPWVRVEYGDGNVVLVNCAHLAIVEFVE